MESEVSFALEDPFDHDGFVISVRRGLVETVLTAMHPDGVFICRAVRPHRTLAKLGYWLLASLLIALGLVGLISILAPAPAWVQGLSTVLSIVFLLLAFGAAIAFAPHSPIVLRLDADDRFDAMPSLAVSRNRRLAMFGQVLNLHGEDGQEVAKLRRYGSSGSAYSLKMDAQTDHVRFVPQQKSRGSAMLASMLGPIGVMGALLLVGKPADSWMIVRAKDRIRIGSLVRQKSDLGEYVLDLTDDLERWADRRVLTLTALTVVLHRQSAQ